MKKLIVKEFQITEEDSKPERQLKIGDKYSYFQDPETGKYYRPKEGFVITRKNLIDHFIEVPCE